MLVKTSELTGAQLDWAVAKCEGFTPLYKNIPHTNLRNKLGNIWHLDELRYSTDWAEGGPIIEQQIDEISRRNSYPDYTASRFACDDWEDCKGVGPTPLIAAMRCYVASKFGNEIDIPNNLCRT